MLNILKKFRNKDIFKIDINEKSFSIQINNVFNNISWDKIKKIEAFKVDKLTYDDIRISFYLFDSDLVYTISEEFENYNVLLYELQNRYNITYDEWLEKVAFPPFEENRITLWRHKSGII